MNKKFLLTSESLDWYNGILPVSISHKLFNYLFSKFPSPIKKEDENKLSIKLIDVALGIISGIPLCCILSFIKNINNIDIDSSRCCYSRCFKCINRYIWVLTS